jgi:hypothetical protein
MDVDVNVKHNTETSETQCWVQDEWNSWTDHDCVRLACHERRIACLENEKKV